ncbi:MAG: sigma-70 family RNA polymerase sigma factor [Verrucomicrobia bacterium]|nr:sigma-70 family RNA polymerase sigma factor [Verrucomicrobiota bacterium]
MNTTAESHTLLRDYAEHGSEAAFAELVRRHLNLVYSAALRRCGGDTALAEDVAQTVFTDLARKIRDRRHEAGELLGGKIPLAGWLYRHTCFVTSTAIRTESRRRQREETAMQLQSLQAEADWSRVAPVLEDVMQELPDRDRDVLVLRYFDQQPLLRVGTALGVGEDAARMRVDRALEKLREVLAKRGVTSTAAALALALAGPAIVVAPAGLAASVIGAALAGTAAVSSISILQTLKIMTSAKIKLGLAALAVAGIATPVVLQQQMTKQLRADNDSLRAQLAITQTATAANQSTNTPDVDELARLRAEHVELLRLRGEAASLNRQLQEAARLAQQNAQTRAELPANEVKPKTVQEEAWEQQGVPLMIYTKQWMLAFHLFANENDGRFPDSFDKAKAHLKGKDPGEDSGLTTDQFEIVFTGSIKDIAEPNKTIIIRQKEIVRGPDGSRYKAYGFADGHSEFHRGEAEGFEKWEQERMQKAP